MTATETSLPEKVHTRRAERALDELASEITILRRRLANGTAEGEDARKSAELVIEIAIHVAAIEILRDGEQS
jgi:hypothetical protein